MALLGTETMGGRRTSAAVLAAATLLPGVLLALAFAARAITARGADLHADELYDLFAARMIMEHGIPVFPSGMLWPAGGPLPYLEAPFVGLAGVLSHWGRAPSVVVSSLSVLMLFWLGRDMFGRFVGLAGAAAWAFDPDAVLWGAYARQYSLHPLLMFMTLYLVRRAARMGCANGTGPAAAVAFIATLWTQPPTIFFSPAFAVAFLLWLQRPALRALVATAAVGLIGTAAVWCYVSLGDPGLIESSSAEGGAIVLPSFAALGLSSLFQRYLPFFLEFPHRTLLTTIAAVSVAAASWSAATSRLTPDQAADPVRRDLLALGSFSLVAVAGLSFFRYGQPGYALALLGPVFLIGAQGLSAIGRGSSDTGQGSQSGSSGEWRAVFPIVLVALLLVPAARDLRRNALPAASDGQMDAYLYIGRNWQPGDAMLDANIVAWVVAAERDPHFFYLCADACGLGLLRKGEVFVNRFIGSPQIRTAEQVADVLDRYPRVWFAIKKSDWENDQRMPPPIRKLVAERMHIVFSENMATVFRTRESAAAQPESSTRDR
jgi:hypothetical protein